MSIPELENLAQTLKRDLPTPVVLPVDDHEEHVSHVALPTGWKTETIDNEALQAHPRRTEATLIIDSAESFIAFVNRYAIADTTVWCQFSPSAKTLSFRAVIDEHGKDVPAWRSHQAIYTPRVSEEWGVWTAVDRAKKSQVEFATFLEDNEQDIASGEGLPTSLDMLMMAKNFEARAEQKVKSKIGLQDGSVMLEYVNASDGATVDRMKIYERFDIGIPVFWTAPTESDAPVQAFRIGARLRYRIQGPLFWYELIRADLVHQKASLALIAEIKAGIGGVPLVMGGNAP